MAAAASQNGAGSGDAAGGGGGEDEDYVPPKPEVQEISEDDALFTKRCKLFYKKDEAFVDRGVGKLPREEMGMWDIENGGQGGREKNA